MSGCKDKKYESGIDEQKSRDRQDGNILTGLYLVYIYHKGKYLEKVKVKHEWGEYNSSWNPRNLEGLEGLVEISRKTLTNKRRVEDRNFDCY